MIWFKKTQESHPHHEWVRRLKDIQVCCWQRSTNQAILKNWICPKIYFSQCLSLTWNAILHLASWSHLKTNLHIWCEVFQSFLGIRIKCTNTEQFCSQKVSRARWKHLQSQKGLLFEKVKKKAQESHERFRHQPINFLFQFWKKYEDAIFSKIFFAEKKCSPGHVENSFDNTSKNFFA